MIHRSRQNAALICAASLLAASLPAVSPATAAGDAPALIVLGPEHRTAAAARLADLTPDQATVLDTLRSNPRVSKLRLGRTPRAALADVLTARALSVHIPPAPAALSFTGVAVKHHGEGMVSLSARTTAQGSAIRLVVQGVDVLGSGRARRRDVARDAARRRGYRRLPVRHSGLAHGPARLGDAPEADRTQAAADGRHRRSGRGSGHRRRD